MINSMNFTEQQRIIILICKQHFGLNYFIFTYICIKILHIYLIILFIPSEHYMQEILSQITYKLQYKLIL